MSTEFLAAKAHPSYAAAVNIANACPEALFCGFKTKPKADGTHAKIPVSKTGAGVGADIDQALLVSCGELAQMIEPPQHCEYWGIFMQNRMTFDPFNDLVLTILDLDTKRSTAPRDIRMVKLMDLAKENGLLTERSHSKKGGHIIFLAKPDQSLPPKIDLGNHQEVEIFGHPGSAGKNVMLTGDSMRGEIIEINCTVKEFLSQAGIHLQEPEAKQPAPQFDFTQLGSRIEDNAFFKAVEALNFINPDIDYDQWIAIGQALHTEFGEAGLDPWFQWSMAGQKFSGIKDIETHWKSFHQGKGVGLGTLYKHAKDHGWQPPTKQTERKSAVEDFGIKYMDQAEAPKTEAQKTRWQPIPLNLSSLEPVDYLIDGFIAHSFSVIAGQPGVGKTTAMLSIALIAAGFKVGDSEIRAEARRKIIYVSEDTAQVKRSLYAYSKHMDISASELNDYFVLIESIRSTADEVIELAHNVIENTINSERPWVIIDTANATLDIENENDNSQVGAFMAALKQTIFTKLNTSICIITHTAKTMSKEDDSAMARGASAYTGDATLTAVLFMDEENNRYLRLIKTRYEPVFREILLISHIHHEAVINRHGNMQDVNCVIVSPQASSAEDRKLAQIDRVNDTKQQRIQDKCDKAVMFVQSLINKHQQVIIRKGSHCPKTPPPELASFYQLEWSEIYQNVPGADRSDVKKAVGTAIFHNFNDTELSNLWVQLT
jgi:RecA-family ATPase